MLDSSTPNLLRLSDVTGQAVDWLWPGRLAAGTLALIDGNPGEGKSLLTLDLAARLSTGAPLPDGLRPPRPTNVVLCNAEDSLEQVLLPRLRAAGANLERIHVFQPRSGVGRVRLPSFPDDTELLRTAVAESGARLIVIDPFLAFVSARCSALNDQLVRLALGPLAELAERTRATIVLVRHLTKSSRGAGALARGTGAMAIIGAARTAFLAGRHPENPELGLFAATKNNLAPLPPTLAYRIGQNADGQPVVSWDGACGHKADELSRHAALIEPGESVREATAFLEDLLAAGPASQQSVVRQARAVGISERTLERAKSRLGVCSEVRCNGEERAWYWSLANNDDSAAIMRDLCREDAELRATTSSSDNKP